MIKFTMNAKELKIMMDKVMTAVNKKVSVPSLKRLYFSIDDKGILKILSTDIDHYVEVRTKNVYHTEPGISQDAALLFQQNEKPGNILKANNNGAMEIPCKSPIP